MGRINVSSIESACAKQIQSKAVQAKISQKCKKLAASGKALGTKNTLSMEQAGKLLFDIIEQNFPKESLSTFPLSSSYISSIKFVNDKYQIDIQFPSNETRRESLCPDEYDGIDNIVALFNNGYEARASVYGYWVSKEKWVWSTRKRPALHFMQESIEQFNSQYGAQYNCKAVLGEQYK